MARRRITSLLSLLSLGLQPCMANIQKEIFIAPPTVRVPSAHPTLDDLKLHVLTPEPASSSIVRTHLLGEFPATSASGFGRPSWVLLDKLNPGQRYEVRVCWAATVSAPALAWEETLCS
jgi:hypothetical protein